MPTADLNHQIDSQKNQIQSGSPKIEIIAPCILHDGIIAIGSQEKVNLIELFDSKEKELLFFIPASGSGSRMFEFLTSSVSDEIFEKDIKVLNFLNDLEHFAFYDDQISEAHSHWKNGDLSSRKLVKLIIAVEGKGFSKSPKGLIPFHQVDGKTLNGFQEHIVQGLMLGTDNVQYHFTIQESFKHDFLSSLDELKKSYNKNYRVDFSFQNSLTDSFAFDDALKPVQLKNGQFLKRPAGHGALIENLNDLDQQIVLIKNIDNIQHPDASQSSIEVWKTLCGLLMKVKSELHSLYDDPSLEGLLDFNTEYQLYTSVQLNINDDSESIRNLINRPLRICGMVQNEGKAGGGPFFVKDKEGSITKQIIEAVQISKEDTQQNILTESTHFNPVMMVLDLSDFDGNKHDLKQYRNDDCYFVVNKMYEGVEISFLELPGLWNGAMYNWNTLFVEVPIETFTPVKTVLDLLDSKHQPIN